MNYNCLVVDDEMELAAATCEYFELFDVKSAFVTDAESCLEFLEQNEVDLLLLDINLKEDNGFTLCKKIREKSQMPILFISARQSDDDILIALNIGGDDYIKKPYTLSVLLAKVKVMLKRMVPAVGEVNSEGETKNSDKNQDADSNFVVNAGTMSVAVGGREVVLKAKEFRLFEYMYNNRNRIVTKDELFNAVWGDSFFSDGTLNVHIRKLREKLEEKPNDPVFIKTVWGTGYILEDK